MKADSLRIAKVFQGGGDIHYVLPHFQREYAWERDNWQTLLTDAYSLYDSYDERNVPEHFLGALVVIEDGLRSGTLLTLRLVDGQQRLTTISVILCVLARLVEDVNSSLARKIWRMLVNEEETGLLRYKLLPTLKNNDRDVYIKMIEGRIESNTQSRIDDAYRYFERQLKTKVASGSDPERLFLVFVNCMHVVLINLNQNERPHEIFESLNAKGKPLTQPDLVRNYIAMRLPEARQETVFVQHWSEIERLLDENRTVSRIGEQTSFLRHYLAYQTGALPNIDHVYARFRDRMEHQFGIPNDFEREIERLHRFAGYYHSLLHPETFPDLKISHQLKRLEIIESTTAYPFLLRLMDAYEQEHISGDELRDALKVLENYFMRRYLAGEQTQYPAKMFPLLDRDIDFRQLGHSLRQALLSRNYPSDTRIREVLPTMPLYNTGRQRDRLILLFETINRHLSAGTGGYSVLDGDPSIEHILPQNIVEWRHDLGPGIEAIYRDYLHTIGNLTIVTQPWNSGLSNSPFKTKRDRLAQNALLLNNRYFESSMQAWDGDAIRARANWLIDCALQIWEAFGEAPQNLVTPRQKPLAITIDRETHDVRSWRDVLIKVVEFSIDSIGVEEVSNLIPTLLTHEERDRAVQLSCGWWLYVSLNVEAILRYCERLTQALGLNGDDWEITLKSEPI